MNAESSDPTEIPGSWHGAITSRWTFQWALDDALFEARMRADADSSSPLYASLIGLLESMGRLIADGQTPEPEERRQFHAMMPSLRMLCADGDVQGEALARRAEELSAYLLEWPAEEAAGEEEHEPVEDGAASGPVIERLDVLIATIYRLRGEIEEGQAVLKKGIKRGSVMARARLDGSREADQELKKMLAAIDAWAETIPPARPRAVKPARGIESPRQLYRYVSEQAGRIAQVRRSFRAWRRRVRTPGEVTEVASFEQLILALHQAHENVAELKKLASEHPAIRKFADETQSILRHVRRWITDWDLPEHRTTGLAYTIAQEIDLLDWPQLPRVQQGVRQLAAMLASWPPESMDFFRKCLYETAIDLDLLRTVSASTAVDHVAREIEQLLYRTANGKEPAKHERKEFRLDQSIARELDLFAWPRLATFIARIRAIDSYWHRWEPPLPQMPANIDAAPQHSGIDELPPTRHQVERGMLISIQDSRVPWRPPPETYNDEGSAEQNAGAVAQGYSRAYFHHLLDAAARDFSTPPMRFPFSRALGLQLRAMRRWTDRGRAPAQDERAATGSVFAAVANIVGGVKETADHATLREVWPVHAYFQRWPEDDKTKSWTAAPAGMIAGPEDFALVAAELVADAAALLVLFPNHDVLLDINRQLQRLNQSAKFGRELDTAEREEIARALADVAAPPAGAMANVPGFAADFVGRVRQAFDYFSGRRASSRPAFEELLRAVLAETRTILSGRNWEQDEDPLAAIDRQLRAMQRWTAGGRTPTAQERQASRDALAAVTTLRGIDRMKEWAHRVAELSMAFAGMEGAAAAAPGSSSAAPVASLEEFGLLLDQTMGDCRSLSGRKLMRKPAGPQIIWDEAAKNLAPIRRMLDQGRVPSQRERTQIHAALLAIDRAGANPCPSIHDFLDDITDRLGQIDAYYAWLVTAGPYAGKEAGGIEAGGLQCVTLGGEMRIAFVRAGGSDPGIYVCMTEKTVTSERAENVEFDLMRYLPTTKNLLRLVPCQDWSPAEIRWNAHSDYLAYRVSGPSPQVGWCATREAGEKGRTSAAAFAWATNGSSLIGVDLASQAVFRLNAGTGERKELLKLPADVSPAITPQIAIPPDGYRLALTYGRAGGVVELSFIEFDGAQPVLRPRAQFPDAKTALPFWSNTGEVACLVIDGRGSDIVCFPVMRGEGQVVYHSDVAEEPIAPAWSSSGKYIAFFQSPRKDNGGGLVLFDCDTKECLVLLKPGIVRGRLSFGEETVCIQGAESAVVLWPRISHKRVVVERF